MRAKKLAISKEKAVQLNPEWFSYMSAQLRRRGLPFLWIEQAKRFAQVDELQAELLYFFSISQILTSLKGSRPYYDQFKFFLDRVLAFSIFVALLPLFAVVALAIKVDSRGPVFFKQLRVGKNGQFFKIYKFRTLYMIHSTSLRPFSRAGEKVRAKDDTRSTRVGRVIRNWKIDELPQLINVMRGEMSLVGPRPFPIEDTVAIPPKYWSRFAVKPGITGLWQAHYPNTISTNKKFAADAWYARTYGFWVDLDCLARTILVVAMGEDYFEKLKSQSMRGQANRKELKKSA